MQIVFFDSGIGGITVLHDTLNVPYGSKTKDDT